MRQGLQRPAQDLDALGEAAARTLFPPGARPSFGRSAARIEEEIVVTADGPKVITLFPCEELMVANAY